MIPLCEHTLFIYLPFDELLGHFQVLTHIPVLRWAGLPGHTCCEHLWGFLTVEVTLDSPNFSSSASSSPGGLCSEWPPRCCVRTPSASRLLPPPSPVRKILVVVGTRCLLGLICISLTWIISCLLAIWVFSSVSCLIRSFVCFSSGLFPLFFFICRDSLCSECSEY